MMTPVYNQLELKAARSQPLAVIFLSVNWSVFSHQSRSNVEQSIALRQAEQSPEAYYIADVSEQSGELWEALQEWLHADDVANDNVLRSGSGPVLWVRSGSVIYQMIDPMNHSPVNIAAVTSAVFQSARSR